MSDTARESTPSWFASKLLFAMPLLILVVYYFGSDFAFKKVSTTTPVASLKTELDGGKLYQRHCAYCHGQNGDGKGLALLNPPARYFGYDKYKFASTDNGIPTDENLTTIISKGIEGSAMPAFEKLLNSDEITAIIGHLRQLTRKGLYDRMMKEAIAKYDEGGDEPNPVQIASNVEKRCTVGKPLPVPEKFPETSAASRANGKRVFLVSCASCHGPEGRGDGPQTKDPKFVNENGSKAIPRDLTAGLYKAGGDHSQLYTRIMLGIPGTPMPASNNLPPQDILDLVNYVKSLPGDSKASGAQ